MGVEEPGFVQKLVRYLFIAFNVLFTIFGLGLVIAGSYGVAKVKTIDWSDLKNLLGDVDSEEAQQLVRSTLAGIAGVIIAIGFITMIISSCGWFGACKQNSCMLFTFSVCMAIIVVLEFILGISVLVVVKKFANPDDKERKEWTHALIRAAETDYASNSSTPLTLTWDEIQSKTSCCGLFGPGDWDENQIPDTCYPHEDTEKKTPYSLGCFEAYSDDLKHIASSVGGVAVGFCIIEILGLIVSCYLACTMRKGSPYEQH